MWNKLATTLDSEIDSNTDESWIISLNEDNKPSNAFKNIETELTRDDLNSPWMIKILIDQINNLKIQVSNLEVYKDNYYERDKECWILKEKISISNSFEILHTICLTVWSIVLWTYFSLSSPYNNWALAIWLLLILVSLITKYYKKWA